MKDKTWHLTKDHASWKPLITHTAEVTVIHTTDMLGEFIDTKRVSSVVFHILVQLNVVSCMTILVDSYA